MAARKSKKPVTYPHVAIAGASRSKFHGRRGSPNNPKKPRFSPEPAEGSWDAGRIKDAITQNNWDVKGMKSDGARAFTAALKRAGVAPCLEVALQLVPAGDTHGYSSRRLMTFGLLRGALAEADEAAWEAAVAVAEAAWAGGRVRLRRALAGIFPDREDWGRRAFEDFVAEYEARRQALGYPPAAHSLPDHILLAGAAIEPEGLIQMVEWGCFDYTPDSEPWLIDMVDRLGVRAAPVLAAFHLHQSAWYDYHVASSRLLATVPSAETIDACVRRLGDWKKLQKLDLKLLKSAPELAIPALEAEVARHRGNPERERACSGRKRAGADRAEALLKELLAERGEASAPAFDRSGLPAGLDTSPWGDAAAPKLPPSLSPASLPPLHIGGAALPLELIRDICGLLKVSSPSEPPPMIAALIRCGDPAELLGFCRALLDQWVDGGGKLSELWVASWIGVLAGDPGLEHLADRLEYWCRCGRHQRSFAALQAFVNAPSDRSAMLLDQLARKSRFEGLRVRASRALQHLAAARGLPQEELLDRIVPDCGLADCPMTLDYGRRSFTAGFDAALRPWVRGDDGKPRKEVPRPGKRDADSAGPARRRWMAVKAAVRGQSREQLSRLERALVAERRWEPASWRAFAAHPLLGLLARGLLWGVYRDGALVASFRVDEAGELVDAEDEAVAPEGAIGLVHPVQLDPQALDTWSAVFADYELVQPFPQLQRPRLGPADAPGLVERLVGAAVKPGRLLRLRRLGWHPGDNEQGFYSRLDGPIASLRFTPGLDIVTSANTDELRTIEAIEVGEGGSPVAVSEALAALDALTD